MDLEDLGTHCALESCNERDFLPIQCNCLKLFCRFHISPDSHSCAAARQPATTKSQPGLVTRPKCVFPGCNKSCLTISPPTTDQADSGEERAAAWSSFCVDHRHEKSSLLPGKSDGDNHAPVRDLVRHVPVHSSYTPVAVRSTKLPTDPAKLAHLQKVNMMKMRHKAVPGDPKDKGSVPVGQRIHVNVRYDTDGSKKEGIFWFRTSIVVGRVLDLLSSHFNIPSSKISTLTLHKIPPVDDGEPLTLKNHQPLAEQIDDASHLVLSY